MTPLIDMVFTLLIFFTLTLHIEREQAASLKPPKADQARQIEKMPPRSLLVVVTADGAILTRGKRQSLEDFESEVASYSQENLPEQLLVRGDGSVRFETVQGVMRAASNAGISKVELSASRETEDLR